MKKEQTARERALVIGGSMAGLLAARTLSDHFKEVIILDRDQFPDRPEHRRGTPQTRHAHGLLASGLQEIEGLFPGISDEMISQGAVKCDPANDGLWVFEGAAMKQGDSNSVGMLVSRPLLEHSIRRRVMRLPNVRVAQGYAVRSLAHHSGRVTGVRTDDGTIRADLTVDASGRGTLAFKWLADIGFEAGEEESVKVDISYTTRMFRRSTDALGGDGFAVITPQLKNLKSGVMLAQEGDLWVATLIGRAGERSPEDLEGFIEYSRQLQTRHIYDVVRRAEPVGDAAVMRYPASVRRRYEKRSEAPLGFLAFGDAICSFNPIYGQGMSVAAQEAAALGEVLAAGDRNLAHRFYKRAAAIIDTPWEIAVGGDLKLPETPGHRSLKTRFINWYIGKVQQCAQTDEAATVAFIRVAQLLDPPESLMRPSMMRRVLKGAIVRRFRRSFSDRSRGLSRLRTPRVEHPGIR
ncbi:MAG: FAD-dependent monooxygenase [Pyrinomonadaceae bacterium]